MSYIFVCQPVFGLDWEVKEVVGQADLGHEVPVTEKVPNGVKPSISQVAVERAEIQASEHLHDC